MTLRTYAVELVQKHDDDLGDFLEPATVDGVWPSTYARMTVVSYDLTDEQHDRLMALPHTIYVGPTSETPALTDPWPDAP